MLELKRGGRTRFSDGDGRIYTYISPCSFRPQIKTTQREKKLHISRCSRAGAAKKCAKKRDARYRVVVIAFSRCR